VLEALLDQSLLRVTINLNILSCLFGISLS
jgi:hypothetical protein